MGSAYPAAAYRGEYHASAGNRGFQSDAPRPANDNVPGSRSLPRPANDNLPPSRAMEKAIASRALKIGSLALRRYGAVSDLFNLLKFSSYWGRQLWNYLFNSQYNMQGWTQNCGFAFGQMYADTNGCNPNVAAIDGDAIFNAQIGHIGVSFHYYVNFLTSIRHSGGVGFAKVNGYFGMPLAGGGANPLRAPTGLPDPVIAISPIPSSVDPWQKPIGQPDFNDEPIPYHALPKREPNPYRNPVEQSSWGNEDPWVGPRSVPRTFPGWVIQPEFLPSEKPRQRPRSPAQPRPTERGKVGTVEDVSPSDFPYSAPAQRKMINHRLRPPPKRTKERKVAMSFRGRRALLGTVNPITEGKDFVEALWKALPWKDRTDHLRDKIGERQYNYIIAQRIKDPKRWQDKDVPVALRRQLDKATPAEMLRDLYRHWGEIDLQKAVKNVVQNEVSDRFYGTAGRYQAKANRRLGLHTGSILGRV